MTPLLAGSIRGRFAPSPTGRLHLGNAATALLAWLQAKALGGEFVLRIEDLDASRCRPHYQSEILRDLEYLGLLWDGPVVKQSERIEVYAEIVDALIAADRAYPCRCSRADVARAAAAPHVGEEGPAYPQTCRHGWSAPDAVRRSYRFVVGAQPIHFVDLLQGVQTQWVAQEYGDIVIADAQKRASYQLAVVVDDAFQGVTHVLRGRDLLSSTPRQIQLQQALNYPAVHYAHVGLLLDDASTRLSKRSGAYTVTALRERGVAAAKVLGLLARGYGLTGAAQVTLSELVAQFRQKQPAAADVSIDWSHVTAL